MVGITLLGLGPGDPAKITREAWDVLNSTGEIWLRTRLHPTVAGFPASLIVHSFDDLYDKSDSFDEVYSGIVDKVLELGQRPEGVVYAVPGDPFLAEATCPVIAQRAHNIGLPVKIVSGLSFLEPVFAALGLDPYPRLTLAGRVGTEPGTYSGLPTGYSCTDCPDILPYGGRGSQDDPQCHLPG